MKLLRILGKLEAIVLVTVFFLYEVVLANLRVAFDVLTLQHFMRPGIVAIPLEARTDLEIALLANLISLTPGTLSLDVSSDRKFLFVHAMYLSDPGSFKRFESLLLKAIR